MKINEEGCLIAITPDDIKNGVFIAPDSVTSIGARVFLRCASLTTISLPKITSIGWLAFTRCTNLMIITLAQLPPGEPYGRNSFFCCDKLLFICINVDPHNTANDLNALQQIREQFPEELRTKVIFKTTYDEILQIKQDALNRLYQTPLLNPLLNPHPSHSFAFFNPKTQCRYTAPEFALVEINKFLGKDNERVNAIMSEIEALPLPRNQQGEIDVQEYRVVVNEYVNESIRIIEGASLRR